MAQLGHALTVDAGHLRVEQRRRRLCLFQTLVQFHPPVSEGDHRVLHIPARNALLDRLDQFADLALHVRQFALVCDIEQGKIATRQGEIAEIQHRIEEEQRRRKPQARVDIVNTGSGAKVFLMNVGPTIIEKFHWELMFPAAYDFVSIRNERREFDARYDGIALTQYDGTDRSYTVATGFCDLPVFQGRPAHFSSIELFRGRLWPNDTDAFEAPWNIYTADGAFSSDQDGEIILHFRDRPQKPRS